VESSAARLTGKNAPFYVSALYNTIFRNISPTRCEYLQYNAVISINIQVQWTCKRNQNPMPF
jgi:hypothetical protein